MKKQFSLFIILLISVQAYSDELQKRLPDFRIISEEKSELVKSDEVQIIVEYKGFSATELLKDGSVQLQTAWDSELFTFSLTPSASYVYQLKAGIKTFKAFLMQGYDELIATDIELKGGTIVHAEAWFHEVDEMIIVDKPVIYAYSDTVVDFSLRIEPKGSFLFTYPEHQTGWDGTIKKNEIVVAGKAYPYLFWEAEQVAPLYLEAIKNDCILKKDIVSYLENKLDEVGLNTKEKTDFITYWGPRLTSFEAVHISWLQNESCNDFAHWHLSGPTATINRLYIVFSPSTTLPAFSEIQKGELQPMERKGVYFVEWGGAQTPVFSKEMSNIEH